MIQVFVPKKRFTEYMGAADLKSIALATVFGTASSSCSFAALAATYPEKWAKAARERVTEDHPTENDAFDRRRRVTSRRGSRMVGNKFVVDWEMVWKKIIIGFTIAGFVAVPVPPGVWETMFLSERSETPPQWLIVLALSGGAA